MSFDESRFNEELEREAMQELDKEMDDIIDEIFYLSQQNLDKQQLWVSGYSGRSYRSSITDTGFLAGSGKVIKKFLNKEIIYSAPYAAGIEFGTQPHDVTVGDLKPWVRRRLKVKKAGRVAEAIAHKISVYGTDPRPFMRPAIDQVAASGRIEVRLNGNSFKRV